MFVTTGGQSLKATIIERFVYARTVSPAKEPVSRIKGGGQMAGGGGHASPGLIFGGDDLSSQEWRLDDGHDGPDG